MNAYEKVERDSLIVMARLNGVAVEELALVWELCPRTISRIMRLHRDGSLPTTATAWRSFTPRLPRDDWAALDR